MTQRQNRKRMSACCYVACTHCTNQYIESMLSSTMSLGLVIRPPCQCLMKLHTYTHKHIHSYIYSHIHAHDYSFVRSVSMVVIMKSVSLSRYMPNVVHARDVHGMEKGESKCRFFFLVNYIFAFSFSFCEFQSNESCII